MDIMDIVESIVIIYGHDGYYRVEIGISYRDLVVAGFHQVLHTR